MHILIYSGYYIPHLGGVERYTQKLASELVALGHRVSIVTSQHDVSLPPHETVEKVDVYRIPIYSLASGRYPIPKFGSETDSITHPLHTDLPEVVILQTRFHLTSVLGARYARRHNIPVMLIEHGTDHFTVDNQVFDYIGKLYEHVLTAYIRRYVTHFYGVSKRCNAWLQHYSIQAKDVLYNSVDAKAYQRFAQPKTHKGNSVVITFAGRLIKEKGIEMLAESFDAVSSDYPGATLIVAGDGPLLASLKTKYKHNQHICFKGKLPYDDTMKLLAESDIFCHPSMYPEGLPTSILEAGLMKNAIIATDRGGTVEVINDRKYGVIIAENRESLESALRTLLDDPSTMVAMQEALHSRIIQNFTWSKVAKQLVREIEGITK